MWSFSDTSKFAITGPSKIAQNVSVADVRVDWKESEGLDQYTHAFQLYHVCKVVKIILSVVTGRELNFATISTSYAPT